MGHRLRRACPPMARLILQCQKSLGIDAEKKARSIDRFELKALSLGIEVMRPPTVFFWEAVSANFTILHSVLGPLVAIKYKT